MTLTNHDLDIFFHLRNHYKKLANPKSHYNFFLPKARARSSCSLSEKHLKVKQFEEKHFQRVQSVQNLPYYNDRSTNVTSLYHTDLNGDPAMVRVKRPTTRRHPNDIPPPTERSKPRSLCDLGKLSRIKSKQCKKSDTAKKSTTDLTSRGLSSPANSEASQKSSKKKIKAGTQSPSLTGAGILNKNGAHSSRSEKEETKKNSTTLFSSEKKKGMGDNTRSSNKVEEHDYLQFLLRVTEDIILNNYYLNEDIERVFKEHMEMNKDTLNQEKMEHHISKLADELNMADVQTSFENQNNPHSAPLSKPHPSYLNLQSLKACDCEYSRDIPVEVYMYQQQDNNYYNYYNQTFQNNLDEIIYYRHSLGRVTECTEPSNSSTTVTKVVSPCPTKSDIALMDSVELDDPNRKLFGTRSEILNLNRNESEDSLSPYKYIRGTVSENIVHQKNPTDLEPDQNLNNETPRKKTNKKNQNINVIKEDCDSCEEEKSDRDTEKAKQPDLDKSDKYKTTKSISGNFNKLEIDSNIEKGTANTENSIKADDNEKFNIEANCPENNNKKSKKGGSNDEKSDTSTDRFDENPEKLKSHTARYKKGKSNADKNLCNEITRKGSNTEYSGFVSDKSESSDITTDKFDDTVQNIKRPRSRSHTKRSKFSTEKRRNISELNREQSFTSDISDTEKSDINLATGDTIAEKKESKNRFKQSTEKGDFKVENDTTDSENSGKEFSKNQSEVYHLTLSNNEDTIHHKIEIETNKSKISLKSDSTENSNSTLTTNSNVNILREIDKSSQTSSHKLTDIQKKPETENKFTQMTYSYTNKGCSTEDEPINVTQSDYVLITCPIYVLKSALSSDKKIVIEKEKFVVTDDIYIPTDSPKQSDIASEATSSLDLKLLGSDYDLTPERDTTQKYHYLMADVSTSMSNVRIPSLSSIQEESLLLGNLYDLHEGTSQEFEMPKEWEIGSTTYRCPDPKALSCDDDIFIRNSEIVLSKSWLTDKSDVHLPVSKKRVGKLKHVRANVNVSNSTSSTSLTC